MTSSTFLDFTQDKINAEVTKSDSTTTEKEKIVTIHINNFKFLENGLGKLFINLSESQAEELSEELFKALYDALPYKELEERKLDLENKLEEEKTKVDYWRAKYHGEPF